MSDINETLTQSEDGHWDFTCPSPFGCGTNPTDPNDRFRSTGWPTAVIAGARGEQHIAEHVHGAVMQDINEFRVDQGMVDATPTPVDLATFLNTPEV